VRVSARLTSLAVRALAESMDVHTMIHLARRLIHNYDLFDRTGFPRNISIPNKDAARQIVSDLIAGELFLDFIIMLIRMRENYFRGRKYRIPYLKELLTEINNEGLVYDKESNQFFEDPAIAKTRNWGVLREYGEYIFTFLRLDTVGSSHLVRNNSREVVQRTYADLRRIVQDAVEKRNGRIWNWEGDGVLVAFYFSGRNNNAVLSAMEIIHELYIYNLIRRRAQDPLRVRIALDAGHCLFRYSFEAIESDTLKKLVRIEAQNTKPDCVTVSSNVYMYLDHLVADQLERKKDLSNPPYYCYELRWE
jgi:class 3 adenylate cyclase